MSVTDPIFESLVAGFLTEAEELAEKLTRDLLELEAALDPASRARRMESIGRALHTLKGSAATVGLEGLAHVAHVLEDLVAPHRTAGDALPSYLVDTILAAIDGVVAQVRTRVATGEVPDPSPLLAEVQRSTMLEDATPSPLEAAARAAGTANAVEEIGREDDGTWRVQAHDLLALMRELERMRDLRLRIEERRRDLEGWLADDEERGTELHERLLRLSHALATDAEEAGAIIENAEDALRAAATVPASTVIDPLRRTVRDLARQLGKRVRLESEGTDLLVDRRVLRAVKGPLVHLVRNAIDHGIERPEARVRSGKREEGRLGLRVEQRANRVVFLIEDDGAGLDLERIRTVAVRQGLVSVEEAAALSPERVRSLVFEPGFSTRSEVSETSGRGVGLDVVRSELRSVDGDVWLDSSPGRGTRFVLTVPVEFGASPLLVVRCRDQEFGIPMVAIGGVRFLSGDELRYGSGGHRVLVGSELLPVMRLGALLGFEPARSPSPGQPLVIVQSVGKRTAIAVDGLSGDRELVLRGLPVDLRTLPSYQGAATMPSGELILVLRPDWLVEQQARPVSAEPTRRALVVDDSLTARALHRTMLEAGGFAVHAAPSGRLALDQLATSRFDVVVADVQMDGMDGCALTEAIRARPDGADLPIILVSANDREADRERGLRAGADAFVSKKDCAAGHLLAEVAQVIARRRAGR